MAGGVVLGVHLDLNDAAGAPIHAQLESQDKRSRFERIELKDPENLILHSKRPTFYGEYSIKDEGSNIKAALESPVKCNGATPETSEG